MYINKIGNWLHLKTSLHCYVKNFVGGNFRIKRYHYDFNFQILPIKSEKNLLTRHSTLWNVFSSMLLQCSVKSAQVLSVQEKVSFFRDILFRSKRDEIKNPHDKYTFQRNKIPVFQKMAFAKNNKSHFLYHFHGTVFLRFKIFK